MKYRKLRIAWSVGWGIICLLLIAVWVRSYWCVDISFFKVTDGVLVLAESVPGVFGVNIVPEECIPTGMYHQPAEVWRRAQHGREPSLLTFEFAVGEPRVAAPYWFWLLIPAAVGTASWLPCRCNRFRLRTLLIATTLVAVLLGLIVWLW